jgi:hypothetical protein
MAQIIVIADSPGGTEERMLYRERVSAPMLESAHATAQLVERLTWAVADAEAAELELDRSGRDADGGRRRPSR